jgi:hypothetical protein
MALEGTTAYVGFGPRLLVIDVSDPAGPRFLGQSDILPDLVRGVDVVDGLAYLAAGKAGLVVLDVGDPAALQVVSEGPNYAGAQPANAHRVIVEGDTAFVVDYNRNNGETSLLQFDISEPEQIVLLDSYSLPTDASVQVTGDLILVISTNQMQLRDAAKPASIMSNTPLAAGNYTSRGVLQDNIVTVVECCAPNGIERFDVSDPYHPAALGPLQELDLAAPFHAAAGDSLMVTASIFGEFGFCQSTVNLFELTAESQQAPASFDPENCLNDLVLDGDRLYLAGRSGLQIYDLSDPANPALLGQFRHPAGLQDVQGLARHDGLLYTLSAEGRGFDLTTLDLDQSPPDMALDRLRIGQNVLADLFVNGQALIIPVWMGGLYTLDISDPAAPQPLHQPVEGEFSSGDLSALAMKEGVFYTSIVDGESIGGIGAIDLSDPANPVVATTLETGVPIILNMALEGDTLYVLGQGERSQVTLYDVSQPLAPEQLATLTLPEFASRLVAIDDTLYAACDGHNCQSIYVVDASDKQDPHVTRRWQIPFGVRGMVTGEGGTIYLVTSEQRIVALDGSDPARLRMTGALELPGEYNRLEIEGDQLHAATFDGGLYQIQAAR